ncbi:hypothetical protein C8R46DRAFT_910335, partial [Mycena filopes]
MHAYQEKIRRIPDRIEKAAKKATSRAADDSSHTPFLNLKEKGVIPDETRDIINDLVAIDGVRPHRVVGVLKRLAAKLGIRVQGDASTRSVRRVVQEGGVASRVQFVEAVGTSKGVTLSSDGTTHKNINLESRRATVIGPDNKKQTFFLGIQSAVNHTSDTQLEGWEEIIETMYKVYKSSSRSETVDDARDFWLKVTGWHSDHAEDQKKLFRLMLPVEMAQMIFQISQDAVVNAGGIVAWEGLSAEQQQALHDAALSSFVQTLGQAEFDKLSEEDKQNIIVLYMDLLLQFLVYVKDNKASRALNHMETNVQIGFNCWYTRHELVVLALMNQNHDTHYLLEIRGRLRAEDNLLKLGPLHEKVKAHLRRIISNPELITSPNSSPETATLDGKPWTNP